MVDGDRLDLNVDLSSDDEFCQKFNQVIGKLKETIKTNNVTIAELHEVSGVFVSSGQVISQEMQDNALNTEQVASAVHQLGMSFQEVDKNSQQCHEDIKHANDINAAIGASVEGCGQAIVNLNSLLSETSQNIDSVVAEIRNIHGILKSIQDISEQTNLLALNASIEAARAGEAGRGFAVVADEVRALSLRTNTSVGEITNTLSALDSNVKVSTENMEKVHHYSENLTVQMDDIRGAVTQSNERVAALNDQVYQISSGITQQTTALEQVNENMTSVNQSSRVISEKLTAQDNGMEQLKQITTLLRRLSQQFAV